MKGVLAEGGFKVVAAQGISSCKIIWTRKASKGFCHLSDGDCGECTSNHRRSMEIEACQYRGAGRACISRRSNSVCQLS